MSPRPSQTAHHGSVRKIVRLAWPMLISQWAGIAFAVLDSTMLGHTNPTSLQAMALSVSIFMTIHIGLMGIIHALVPICAQLFGARRPTEIGRFIGQGIWLSLFLSALGGSLLLFPDVWLSFSGDLPLQVRQEVTLYLRICCLALPATLMFRCVYALATSVQRPRLLMYVSLASVLLKLVFNWLLIFGHAGLPALGSTGAATSTAMVSWIALVVGVIAVLRDPFYRQFQLRLGKPAWSAQKEILQLGLPMGGSYLAEVSSFTFMALLAAREGTIVSGGHQILANLVSLLYMFPLAIGIATSSLVAQSLGAQQPGQARHLARMGIRLGLTGVALSLVVVMAARPQILQIYTSDPAIAAMAYALLTILPLLHTSDALQCMLSYILRAHKIATMPFVIQTGSLFGIGLLGGWYFGFGPGYRQLDGLAAVLTPGAPPGVASLWIMCSFSMLLCAITLAIWYWKSVNVQKR
ncbi:MATE family efflux transporter [Advenella mimigardefordensis]|uniref:Multidrug-efflux transporter n=1 Tax=Advenella mimigardefordensis (strain DSM 17166 / LMG 22922 / DPN7) TaxID=1247726 RepID=W0PCF6_ADVMD|nr:MATE family efflux transporter [Advenella mimigardefordensis]AHG64421.1 putative MATE efflux family protein [Advenella mimigardefordensis DPN7]